MNTKEFTKFGTEVLDYLVDYIQSLGERYVLPNVKPGFMKQYIQLKAPENSEKWENLMQDLESYIMPGLVHWLHPNFYSYFPLGASNASLLGVLLSGAIASNGDTWINCPSSTELDMIVIDWLATALNLPDKFHFFKKDSKGGGSFQGSASECSLLCMIAAQRVSLEKLKEKNPSVDEGTLLSLQTAYCSKQAHSSIEKASKIAMVNLRILDTDEEFQFRGQTLEEAIENDIKNGFYPFYCAATIGTTSCASVDKFNEIGPICKKYDMWFHIDGAFGISGLVCPEFRHLADGFEYASSFDYNPYKWLLMHLDCAIMWVDDRMRFLKAIAVDPNTVKEYPDTIITNYDDWGITGGRRFKSLKVWFTMRKYGVEGLQKHVRNHVQLAHYFADFVRNDNRFEVVTLNFCLVCFRLKTSNDDNAKLLNAISSSRKIFMVPSSLGDKYVIRFCVDSEYATENDIKEAWEVIVKYTEKLGLGSNEK